MGKNAISDWTFGVHEQQFLAQKMPDQISNNKTHVQYKTFIRNGQNAFSKLKEHDVCM